MTEKQPPSEFQQFDALTSKLFKVSASALREVKDQQKQANPQEKPATDA